MLQMMEVERNDTAKSWNHEENNSKEDNMHTKTHITIEKSQERPKTMNTWLLETLKDVEGWVGNFFGRPDGHIERLVIGFTQFGVQPARHAGTPWPNQDTFKALQIRIEIRTHIWTED